MNLNDLRKKINSLDDKIVHILNTRAEITKSIGSIKNNHHASWRAGRVHGVNY